MLTRSPRFYIVIPAHNEEQVIGQTLHSLLQQTLLPQKIVVVDDNSDDRTAEVVERLQKEHTSIRLLRTKSTGNHLPGHKIVKAFQLGYELLDDQYDFICKFDADLVFPENYLELLVDLFSDSDVGIAGGFCLIRSGQDWKLENLTSKDHVRGALKTYRKACFEDIGGLVPAMGWDTVDEMKARYRGWKIRTDSRLLVKHLRPTGSTYHRHARWIQGEAFYRMRYGIVLTSIASAKLAWRKKKPLLFWDYLQGYFKAYKTRSAFLVDKKEGAFIRRLRFKNMLQKLF